VEKWKLAIAAAPAITWMAMPTAQSMVGCHLSGQTACSQLHAGRMIDGEWLHLALLAGSRTTCMHD